MLIVSAISIIAAVSFVTINHAEKSFGFAVESVGRVDPSGMNLSLIVCNPSVVPVTLEGIAADLGGSSGTYGSISVPGGAVQPLSEQSLQGRMDFADFDTMKTVVNWVLDNQSGADFKATVLVKAKFLGLIPYSSERIYDLPAFSSLLFGSGPSTCHAKNNSEEIKQQLTLAQARMSVAGLLYSDKASLGNETNNAAANSTFP